MQYWEDFTDKYGFNDGSSVPTGVEYYCAAYCLGVNYLLSGLQSTVRVMPFERPGMHNPYLITTVSIPFYEKQKYKIKKLHPINYPADFTPATTDEKYTEAVYHAMDLGLDGLVVVRCKFNTAALKEYL